MVSLPSEVECIIIPFPQRRPAAGLTARDRIEVSNWQEDARRFGYDRLVIHEREAFDPPGTDSFLSIYRTGDPWSRWGLSRQGSTVFAWCSNTGADLGPFTSVSDALMTILPATNERPLMPRKVVSATH